MDNWIDVTEQLPEIETAVLVFESNFGMEVDCMEYNDHGDLVWCGNCKRSMMVKVTHWMDLPEPPQD